MGNAVLKRFLLLSTLVLCAGAPAASDSPPGCPEGDCGIVASGMKPYDVMVVGHPLKILDDAEMRALYRWARARAWKDFPDDEADYLERNRVALMPTGNSGKPVFVHMARTDYDPAHTIPAALIRYSPREMPDSYYPDGRPIHSALAGCVAILCTAGDDACMKNYPSGMFRHKDGVELNPRTKGELPGGRTIDPQSMREKAAALRAKLKLVSAQPLPQGDAQ